MNATKTMKMVKMKKLIVIYRSDRSNDSLTASALKTAQGCRIPHHREIRHFNLRWQGQGDGDGSQRNKEGKIGDRNSIIF